MESEETLALQWLNARESYDAAARSIDILNNALSVVPSNGILRIADLGAGTGNHTLFLLDHLHRPASIQIVEQHSCLLSTCRQRVTERFYVTQEWEQTLEVRIHGCSHKLEFVQLNLLEWLELKLTVDLYSASALLDLLTEDELTIVINAIRINQTPFYSTLNYAGIQFSPTDLDDQKYIKLFEKHMSRLLDRGRPLGAEIISVIDRLCQAQPFPSIVKSTANWHIPSNDRLFLEQNMAFYLHGISDQLNEPHDVKKFERWQENKKLQIGNRQLSLTVEHQDILFIPDFL